ncbi:hypothetical protein EON79_09240 [bacterium]|nr:MAG: hypothetical protein EON79_09240 [bacterium]
MLILPILLAFQTAEGSGYKTNDFALLGSDGKKYTVKTLTKGKPVFLVNLYDMEGSQGIADLNRLSQMTMGKVRVVGLTTLSTRGRGLARVKELGVRFLVLGSDDPYSILDIVPRLVIKEAGSVSYLSNTLLLPDRRLTHVWEGYNRWTLKRMSQDALKYGHVRLKIDFSRFPEKLQRGYGEFYGLGPG